MKWFNYQSRTIFSGKHPESLLILGTRVPFHTIMGFLSLRESPPKEFKIQNIIEKSSLKKKLGVVKKFQSAKPSKTLNLSTDVRVNPLVLFYPRYN